MIKFNKVVMAAITAVVLSATPSMAGEDPISSLLDGMFQQPHTQATVKVARRHGRHAEAQPATEQADNGGFFSNIVSGGQRMVASFYGHGEKLSRHTASGAVFNPHAMTAAHKTLPFGTVLQVCHRGCVHVTINDRGPFVRGRQLDLSYGAARAIGMGSTSTVHVARVN